MARYWLCVRASVVAADIADYYSRYRPGLPLVLAGLTLATCLFQYAAQWLSRFGDVGRVNECAAVCTR